MKKLLAITLTIVMLFGVISVSATAYSTGDEPITVEDAIKEHETIYNVTLEKNRYYFLMPDGTNGMKSLFGLNDYEKGDYVSSWYNEYADSAYIHWKDSGIVDTEYPGYVMMKSDCDNVYYADMIEQHDINYRVIEKPENVDFMVSAINKNQFHLNEYEDITITADVYGGIGPYEYCFVLGDPSEQGPSPQDFSQNNVLELGNLYMGTYKLTVYVKDANGNIASSEYTFMVEEPVVG